MVLSHMFWSNEALMFLTRHPLVSSERLWQIVLAFPSWDDFVSCDANTRAVRLGPWAAQIRVSAALPAAVLPAPLSLLRFGDRGFPSQLMIADSPPVLVVASGTAVPDSRLGAVVGVGSVRSRSQHVFQVADQVVESAVRHGASLVCLADEGAGSRAAMRAVDEGVVVTLVVPSSPFAVTHVGATQRVLASGGSVVYGAFDDLVPDRPYLVAESIVAGLSGVVFVPDPGSPLGSQRSRLVDAALRSSRMVVVPKHEAGPGSDPAMMGARLLSEQRFSDATSEFVVAPELFQVDDLVARVKSLV